MVTYRYEISKTARASCQMAVCKKEGPKIQKGELRFGNWADYGDYQGWKWKHWGCVTPLQIANIQQDLEGLDLDDDEDMNVLDGWDELTNELQDKIRQALKDGHVADEEWKGDLEQNRPGKRGMFLSAKAKRDRDAEAEAQARAENGDDLPDDTPVKPKKARKIKKNAAIKQEEEDLADREETPVPSKKRGKKVKTEEFDESAEEVMPAKKRRGKKVKAESDEETAEEVMPTKKKRASPKKRKADVDDDVKVEDDDAVPEPPKKAARARKGKVKQEDPGADMATSDKTNLQKEAAVMKEEQPEDMPDLDDLPEIKLAKRSRAKRVRADANLADDLEDAKPAKKSKARKVKQELVEDDQIDELEHQPGVLESARPAPKPRGKKAAPKRVPVKEEPKSEDDLAGPMQNGEDEDVKEEVVDEKPKPVKRRTRGKKRL